MSKMFEKIKSYYDDGLWTAERVRNIAEKGIITHKEYTEITGKEW